MTDCCPKCGNLRYDGTEAGYRSDRCHCADVAPSIEGTATALTPATMRRGIEAMKAGDAKRRAMPFPASETGEPVTSYTVAREAERKNAAQEWLIAYDEVKLILDNTVKVGTTDGKTMVFNKREAAAKITQIVNDRYNAKKGV